MPISRRSGMPFLLRYNHPRVSTTGSQFDPPKTTSNPTPEVKPNMNLPRIRHSQNPIYISDDSESEDCEEGDRDGIVVLEGEAIPIDMRRVTNQTQPIELDDDEGMPGMLEASADLDDDDQHRYGAEPRQPSPAPNEDTYPTPPSSSSPDSTRQANFLDATLSVGCRQQAHKAPPRTSLTPGYTDTPSQTAVESSSTHIDVKIDEPETKLPKTDTQDSSDPPDPETQAPVPPKEPTLYDKELQKFFIKAIEDFTQDETIEDACKELGLVSPDDLFSDLTVRLMTHQIFGVSWMIRMEKNETFRGGLLCDAMGLGKTVQAIATIVGNRSQDPEIKTTLVVAPVALLSQWKKEIESKTKARLLKVLIYHGQDRPRSTSFLGHHDIVITTYGTLVSEYGPDPVKPRKKAKVSPKTEEERAQDGDDENNEEVKKEDDEDEDSDEEEDKFVREQGPLFHISWYRVVLDESHNIRNRKKRTCRAACALESHLRWSVTGTLINNTLEDIYAHLKFTGISPYRDWHKFHPQISKILKRRPHTASVRAQAILQTCMLRRDKDSRINGKRLLDLPPKTTQVIELEFSEEEQELYDAIEAKMKTQFNYYLRQGIVEQKITNILVMLMRLRQFCNHPGLLRKYKGILANCSSFDIQDDELFETIAKQEDEAFVKDEFEVLEDEEIDELDDSEDDGGDSGYKPTGMSGKRRAVRDPSVKGCVKRVMLEKKKNVKARSSQEAEDIDDSSSILLSTKMKYIDTALDEYLAEPGTKVIMFSQFVDFIDLLSAHLKNRKISHEIHIGSMSRKDRDEAILKFTAPIENDKSPRVMIISLRSGGVGLNLTAACKVICIDPAWNMAQEQQAVDRAHRIGQTRPVEVRRLIVKDTVEERILAMSDSKKMLADRAMGVGPGGRLKRFARATLIRDLQTLFGE